MPAHRDFLDSFDTALRGGPLPAGLLARAQDDVARRFDVYRNNVAASLSQALSSRFPVIRRLVGDAYFAALARLYADADRPKSPVLAEWGAGFAGFVETFPPLAGFPYMGDVARIEYARGRAFHAGDARPIDPALFATADPARIRLRLHPSVTLLPSRYPAVSIWAQNQEGATAAPLDGQAQTALILRDAAFQVPVTAVGAGDAALIGALLAGAVLADAAAAGGAAQPEYDPTPQLVALMQAGAIVEARE